LQGVGQPVAQGGGRGGGAVRGPREQEDEGRGGNE
jgi:hypothetical protein